MSDAPKGFYIDADGNMQVDRRVGGPDRRGNTRGPRQHEQRSYFRRKADREQFEKDHKTAIREALEDFAEEHDGHL